MKKATLTSILLFLFYQAVSQAPFEKGYIIGNDGQRIECLIQIPKWNGTPQQVNYRVTDTSAVFQGNPANIQEFAINGGLKFIGCEVQIDLSGSNETNPGRSLEPEWEKQRLFLQVLVEGRASLYLFEEPVITRFFFSTDTITIEQLVFKMFRLPSDELGTIRTNTLFRQQLWKNLPRNGFDVREYEKVEYDKNDLAEYFIAFNKESQIPFKVYSRKKESPVFVLRITPGLTVGSLKVRDEQKELLFSIPARYSFRAGVETELIFPYTHRKVSLVLEPSYNMFTGTEYYWGKDFDITLHTIEFPLGVRYYMHLSPDLRIFLNLLYVPALSVEFQSEAQWGDAIYTVSTKGCLAGGGGFGWKRFGLELRMSTPHHLFYGSSMFVEKYSRMEVILGFRIFGTR